MSGLGIALATRGVICCKQGAAVVTTLIPDAQPSVLEPELFPTDKGAPEILADASDLECGSLSVLDTLAPQLQVVNPVDPVPDAKPKAPSEEPSVEVQPLSDLSPTIVDKD